MPTAIIEGAEAVSDLFAFPHFPRLAALPVLSSGSACSAFGSFTDFMGLSIYG
jgi:hypothetical protein